MAVLSKEFKDALCVIEPGEDAEHAAAAHAEVREVLEGDADVREWGLHTVLIGSYAREVSIRRVKDVDVFCELPELPDDQDPQELLNKFEDVLSVYGDRVRRNDRSVKVDFPDYDMHVDLVPARRSDSAWQIPDKDGGWERTHPVEFGELKTARNQDHGENYVPVVKLVRQTRRALLGPAKPSRKPLPARPLSTSRSRSSAWRRSSEVTLKGRHRCPIPPCQIRRSRCGLRLRSSRRSRTPGKRQPRPRDQPLTPPTSRKAGEKFKSLLGMNSDGDDVFTVVVKSTTAAATTAVAAGHRNLPSGSSPTFA